MLNLISKSKTNKGTVKNLCASLNNQMDHNERVMMHAHP